MTSFAQLNLDPKIHQAIQLCGYETPTEIQAKSIPIILQGKDLVGATETGSGKTAAFVLPALNLLANTKLQKNPRVLFLTPTRELAHQITESARTYGKFVKFTITSIIGGVSYAHQERMLSKPLDMIVATPGRLMDHVSKGRINLSEIKMFVLDEGDRMLDMGFLDDIKKIRSYLPKEVQTLLFTATLDKKLNNIIAQLLNNPINVDLSKALMVPEKIGQQIFVAKHHDEKMNFLENLLEKKQIFKAIIFTATKHGADKLAHHLKYKGHRVLPLHGDLNQRVRKQSLEQLKDDKIQYLVATDVAARGLHIDDISHVIQFDLPRCLDDYIHRVGRTGRAGKDGEAITIATNADRRYILRIEKTIGRRLQQINFDHNVINKPIFEEVFEKKPKRKFGKRRAEQANRTDNKFSQDGQGRKQFSQDNQAQKFKKRPPKKTFTRSTSHRSKDQ